MRAVYLFHTKIRIQQPRFLPRAVAEKTERHSDVMLCERSLDRFHRDAQRFREGIAVDTGGDQWERQTFAAFFCRKCKRPTIAARQERRLAVIAALPDRPNRVDHITRRQIVAAG